MKTTLIGRKVQEIKMITHVWIPGSKLFFKILPYPLYHFLCKIWSIVRKNRQIRITVVK
ncbi:MAG: hypothetical protein GWO87_00340 [Xanthomonadaceae bacterium]|nr:hypothetical protein [Rhodospirillaceae bacterium]NIA17629.1 hypothetical protein [Xanthomonadaceae bacterium]